MGVSESFVDRFRPAHRLVVACARVERSSAGNKVIAELLDRDLDGELDSELDWNEVIAQARFHGVLQLLWHQLSQTELAERLPGDLRDSISREYGLSVGRNLFMTRTLLHVLQILTDHNIAAIPFKGPVLAHRIYGDVALRPFSDMDVLVHRERIEDVKAILVEEGFRPTPAMTAAEEKRYLDSQFAYSFVKDVHGAAVDVEIHWAPTHRFFSFDLDPESLWRNQIAHVVGGVEVPTFSDEDLFLFLCVHGAKHHWERLVWIVDLAEMLASQVEIDWDRVVEQAGETRSRRLLFLGVELVRRIRPGLIPAALDRHVPASGAANDLALQVGSWLFKPVGAEVPTREANRFHTRSRESLRDRIPQYWHQTSLRVRPTKKDFDAVDVPRGFSFLYYLVRPIRAAMVRLRGGRTE